MPARRKAAADAGLQRRIYLLGGSGSPSGEQGKKVPGLRGFDSQFYYLDDIWELNLESNSWRQLLPLGHFDPDRLRAAVYHPVLKGLLIFEGIPLGNTQRGVSSVWLFRPDIDQLPVKLRMSGQISDLAMVSACALDPLNNEVLLRAEDGIFRVIAEPI